MDNVKPKPNGKRPRAVQNTGNIYVGIIVFLLLSVYMGGYLYAYFNRASKATIEVLREGTIDPPPVQQGIIVRDEAIYYSNTTGSATYYYSEGQKVKKSDIVCSVNSSNNVDSLISTIAKYDESSYKNRLEVIKNSTEAASLKRVNTQIKQSIEAIVPKLLNNNPNDIYSFSSKLSKELDLRNQVVFSVDESDGSTDKQKSFVEQLEKDTISYSVSEGGIVSFLYDGYENVFNNTGDVTENHTMKELEISPHVQTKNISPGDFLFKVVSSNTWNIVAYVDAFQVADWEEGQVKTIYISNELNVIPVSMEVLELITDEYSASGRTRLVLTSNNGMIDFIEHRTVSFEIKEHITRGLKVPNKAIIEKSLLKIPLDFVYEEGTKRLVYKSASDSVELNVTSKDGDFIYAPPQYGKLDLNDIIVKYSSGSAVEHKLTEVVSKKGIYIANRGVADYKQINVLSSNNDYSIVESNNPYGVKPFDSFVSDATGISDGQLLN